jgi:RNA polymerase sigma-70 factor (ECF subfamily)
VLSSRQPTVTGVNANANFDGKIAAMSALLRAFRETAMSADAAAVRMTYDTAELADALAALYARGRKSYPRLPVDEEAFGRCVARCVDDKSFRSLEALAAEDLYLACACAAGTRGAAAAFEAEYAKVIRRAVSRAVPKSEDRDDAEQRALQHLLVGTPGAGPAIAKYVGHVPLATWIPVVAIRVAISLKRTESAEQRLRAKAGAEAIGINPEHLYIREELRRAVEPAVADALGRLDDRDRLILRLFLVSGLTLRAIGDSLDLSQPAVSKRLAKARAALLRDVRSALTESLHISEDEFSSILRVVASQLDVNVSRDLRSK